MFTMRVLLCLALMATCALCTGSTGKFSTCCTRATPGKPKPGTVIETFEIQPEDPPCVRAVMFIANDGSIYCSTPGTRWVKQKMMEIRKKNQEENNSLNGKED